MFDIESVYKKGFVDAPIDAGVDLVEEINTLRKEKNAIILAHFYQTGEIQDIADFVGDSLKLAQLAESTEADIILFAGVHFMAETAKILSPEKKVLAPDLNAGCSLADSCKAEDFEVFLNNYPDHKVVTYVNTSADIKALSDVVITSSNAKQIVDSFDADQKLVFAPDRNLGNYINGVTGRDMVIWDGACHVHEQFSLERILEIKKDHPNALLLVHPECEQPVRIIADHIGSTSSILNYSKNNDAEVFIVATESGILHQMQKANPDKIFIPAPPNDSTCACNDCAFMKLNTMEKIYNSLKYEMPVIELENDLIEKAKKPILKMLEISEKLGL